MKTNKTLIYLADLTHTGPVIYSNYLPLATGLLGSQLLREIPALVEIEILNTHKISPRQSNAECLKL